MMTKIKKELVKWSRNEEKFEKASQIFLLITLIFFVSIVLPDMGLKLFPEIICKVFMGIALVIAICLKGIGEFLGLIKINEQNIYKNKLLYIFFSSKEMISSIIVILYLIIGLVVEFKLWMYVLLFILFFVIPKKVSNYFKQKLSE